MAARTGIEVSVAIGEVVRLADADVIFTTVEKQINIKSFPIF